MSADVTQILSAIDGGDPEAARRLLSVVYEELRGLAAARLAQERPGQTLQATALVHEAWLRIVDRDGQTPKFSSRAHFFGAAAEAMRRILVDRARARGAVKRGGDRVRVDLDPEAILLDEVPGELLDLDEVLTRLAETHPEKAQLVTLRFFGGLTHEEAAAVLEMPISTADRYWAYARAWLYRAMDAGTRA